MNVDRTRWKLLTEACGFFFYLCDVGARVNEPQQRARKDILMSAHASPCFKTKAVFCIPVKDKWHRQLLKRMSSYRFLLSVLIWHSVSISLSYHCNVKGYWVFFFGKQMMLKQVPEPLPHVQSCCLLPGPGAQKERLEQILCLFLFWFHIHLNNAPWHLLSGVPLFV